MVVKLKLRLLDILVCPEDKHWPLKIHIFKEKKFEKPKKPMKDSFTDVVCKYFCGKKNILITKNNEKNELTLTIDSKNISYTNDCHECFSIEVEAGLIECEKCKTYYPIIDEIPMMLKEELRNEEIERDFTTKWANEIQKLTNKTS